MRRRIAAILFAFAAVVVTTACRSEPPASAETRHLYLPIVARSARVHRGPMTRWTAFARTRFHDLAVDANGVVFASADDGVLRWDSASATGEHRWLTQAEGVPAGPIGALALDPAGNLWLAAKPTATLADADATTGVRRLAPDGTWRDFTTADGLAGNAVYAIEVDPDGRVWVAAWHGVSRREADGTWTTIRNPNEHIACSGLDCWHTKFAIAFGGGMTWFGHAGGVSRLAADGRWYEWAADPARRIAADRLGRGWTADRLGAYVTRYEVGNVHGVVARKHEAFAMADLVFDAADRLWVGGAGKVESLGPDGRWRVEGGPSGLPTDGLTRLAVDPEGHVWAALGGTIVRLDADGNGPVLRIGLPLAGDRIHAIAQAPDGSMWLGVADTGSPLGGLAHVARDGGWSSRTLEVGSPDPVGVGHVVVDQDGTLWASDGRRLLRRVPEGSETVFESRVFGPNAYFSDIVLSGDGTLWTAVLTTDESLSVDGFAALHPDGRWQHFLAEELAELRASRLLAYDARREELWFGGGGLSVRGADGVWHTVGLPDGMESGPIRHMVVDGEGGRWFIAGHDELWSLSPDGRWDDHGAALGFGGENRSVVLNVLAADPNGGIWCGTSLGLVRLDVDGVWRRIALPFAHPDDAWQAVRSLAFDAAGRLWVGTDAGVARLE